MKRGGAFLPSLWLGISLLVIPALLAAADEGGQDGTQQKFQTSSLDGLRSRRSRRLLQSQTCEGRRGVCRATDEYCCFNRCVTKNTDVNCGKCGAICGSGQKCCLNAAGRGFKCVDVLNDVDNCGSCGVQCSRPRCTLPPGMNNAGRRNRRLNCPPKRCIAGVCSTYAV